MIIEPTGKGANIFLDKPEYEEYLEYCDERTGLAARIMGRSSPRVEICSKLKRGDFFIPDRDIIKTAYVKLKETKDTSEGGSEDGGWRLSWVPMSLYEDIQSYCEKHNIEDDEEIFEIDKDQIRNIMKSAGAEAARHTGKEGYKYITPHDMRRYYATHMLRREGVDIDIVMSMGGWENRKSMEPYLRTPLEKDLQTELVQSGVLEVDVGQEPKSFKDKIEKRLRRIENALRLEESPIDLGDLRPSELDALVEKVKKEKQKDDSSVDRFDLDQPMFSEYVDTDDNKVQCLNWLTALPWIGVWFYPRAKNRFLSTSEDMDDDPELINPNTPRGLLRFCMCSVLFVVMFWLMLALGFSVFEYVGVAAVGLVVGVIKTDVNPEREAQSAAP